MKIDSHINELFHSVTYRFENTIVDPGDLWNFEGVDKVLLTHGHFDHIYGLNKLMEISPNATIYTNSYGLEMLLDMKKNLSFYLEKPFIFIKPESIILIEDDDYVSLSNNIKAKAIFTPGHSPSCITWKVDNYLFTGDSYIPGTKTVTKIPNGNRDQAIKSQLKILKLSEGLNIFPGHKIL